MCVYVGSSHRNICTKIHEWCVGIEEDGGRDKKEKKNIKDLSHALGKLLISKALSVCCLKILIKFDT